jgi:hypothetical protein
LIVAANTANATNAANADSAAGLLSVARHFV